MLFRQHALAIFCSTIMLVCGVACADTKTSREQANLKQETQKQLSSGTEKTESESKEFSNQQLCGRSAESISFNKGSGGGSAPGNWKPLPGSGTNQGGGDWLYSYVSSWTTWFSGVFEPGLWARGACDVFTMPSGWKKKREKIVADCSKESTAVAKVLCASKKINIMFFKENNKLNEGKKGEDYEDTYVCRHHAVALSQILDDLGLHSDLECSFTHAWVETKIDGKRVILDAYNDYYIIMVD